MRQPAEAYIRERIADHCVKIEDIFKKDRPRYVTVIVRPPDAPNQEVIVTNDPDIAGVIETIRRRCGLHELQQASNSTNAPGAKPAV